VALWGAVRALAGLLEQAPPLLVGFGQPYGAARMRRVKRIIEGAGHGGVIMPLDESLQLGAARHKRQIEQILPVEAQQVERPQAQLI